MILLSLFVGSFLLFSRMSTQDCLDCVQNGKVWCVDNSQCSNSSATVTCGTLVDLDLNCPTTPKVPYDDNFVRTQHVVFAAAAQSDDPQTCFDNNLPTMKLYQRREVSCSPNFTDVFCVGYTAVDVSQRAILMAVRGSRGQNQSDLIFNGYNRGLQNYFSPETGKIFKVFYDQFMYLWSGGMQQDLRQLKYKYPTFDLWINGHSLGAVIGWTASTELITSGLFKPEQIKIVTFGAPRLGDYTFAKWFTSKVAYSFNIVHASDLIPRTPIVDPQTNTTLVYHPRNEVWYNNDMTPGEPYVICPEADQMYCSGLVTEGLNWMDHIHYFNVSLPTWGRAGCPKNATAYGQPGSD